MGNYFGVKKNFFCVVRVMASVTIMNQPVDLDSLPDDVFQSVQWDLPHEDSVQTEYAIVHDEENVEESEPVQEKCCVPHCDVLCLIVDPPSNALQSPEPESCGFQCSGGHVICLRCAYQIIPIGRCPMCRVECDDVVPPLLLERIRRDEKAITDHVDREMHLQNTALEQIRVLDERTRELEECEQVRDRYQELNDTVECELDDLRNQHVQLETETRRLRERVATLQKSEVDWYAAEYRLKKDVKKYKSAAREHRRELKQFRDALRALNDIAMPPVATEEEGELSEAEEEEQQQPTNKRQRRQRK